MWWVRLSQFMCHSFVLWNNPTAAMTTASIRSVASTDKPPPPPASVGATPPTAGGGLSMNRDDLWRRLEMIT